MVVMIWTGKRERKASTGKGYINRTRWFMLKEVDTQWQFGE